MSALWHGNKAEEPVGGGGRQRPSSPPYLGLFLAEPNDFHLRFPHSGAVVALKQIKGPKIERERDRLHPLRQAAREAAWAHVMYSGGAIISPFMHLLVEGLKMGFVSQRLSSFNRSVGLHAERARQGDRLAEDHGEGSREATAQGRGHRRPHRQSQKQRADQGPQRPAAGRREHRYRLPRRERRSGTNQELRFGGGISASGRLNKGDVTGGICDGGSSACGALGGVLHGASWKRTPASSRRPQAPRCATSDNKVFH